MVTDGVRSLSSQYVQNVGTFQTAPRTLVVRVSALALGLTKRTRARVTAAIQEYILSVRPNKLVVVWAAECRRPFLGWAATMSNGTIAMTNQKLRGSGIGVPKKLS